MEEQTAGRGNADRWIRVMKTFFNQRKHGERHFPQDFGGEEARLVVVWTYSECGTRGSDAP